MKKIDELINDLNSARRVLNIKASELTNHLRKVNLNVSTEKENKKRLMQEIRSLLENLNSNMMKKIPANLYLTYKYLGSQSRYYK